MTRTHFSICMHIDRISSDYFVQPCICIIDAIQYSDIQMQTQFISIIFDLMEAFGFMLSEEGEKSTEDAVISSGQRFFSFRPLTGKHLEIKAQQPYTSGIQMAILLYASQLGLKIFQALSIILEYIPQTYIYIRPFLMMQN